MTLAHKAGATLAAALACTLAWPAPAAVKLSAEAGGSYALQVTSYKDMPFRTVVRQRYDFSCGSAALATLLSFHYGRPTTEQAVFARMFDKGDQPKIRAQGFSLLDMKTYLQSIGLRSDGYRISLDDLSKSGTPAIAVVTLGRYRHFVVIKGVGADKVLVGDPAQGLKVYPRPAFMKMWNGVVFMIDTNGAAPAFNRAGEWNPRPRPPGAATLPDQSLASFTLQMPTLFQVTPMRSLTP